jgi:putative ABC transport system ATP-binding protein
VTSSTSSTQPAAARETLAASTRGLTKTYGRGDARVHALRGVDLDVRRGGFTAIMGPSGSGKSTLMHCLAGLDQASGGTVTVAGTDLGALDDDALTIFRREHVGFVFQSFNLLPMLTAGQNILLPLELGACGSTTRPGSAWTCSPTPSAWPTGSATAPRSCPAASSSGSQSPGP